MGFFSKIVASRALKRLEEERLFEHVHDELENEIVNDGLWMKAIADSKGDMVLAKTKYIKLRIQSIRDERTIQNEIRQEADRVKNDAEIAKEKSKRAQEKAQKSLNKSLIEAGKRLRQ